MFLKSSRDNGRIGTTPTNQRPSWKTLSVPGGSLITCTLPRLKSVNPLSDRIAARMPVIVPRMECRPSHYTQLRSVQKLSRPFFSLQQSVRLYNNGKRAQRKLRPEKNRRKDD